MRTLEPRATLRSIALALFAAALAAGAGGCKKTNTCKTGTAMLALRFDNPAQMGDSVDITVDVSVTPHETLTGTLDLIPGTRGGTVEVHFRNAYQAGAPIVILARAMSSDGQLIQELQMSTTLSPGCSYITVQASTVVSPDGAGGEDAPGDVPVAGPDGTSGDGGGLDDGAPPAGDGGDGDGDAAMPVGGDAAPDRPFVEVGGGSDGPCPGICKPGDTLACGKCGTKTCTMDCAWSACGNEGNCLAGSTRACGNCGIQVCDPTCQWEVTCHNEGVCKPGDSMTCGNCGHQTCGATCAFDACAGDGQCAPGATRACGRCGVEKCNATTATCGWSGVCENQGACTPGSSRPCGVGNCGVEMCGNDCQWTGSCSNPGQCIPGDTGGCGNCGTMTCGTDCKWPTAAGTCTGQGPCAPNQTGTCGNCGTITCAANCQWPTGAAACTGQGVCSPGDSVDCGRCGDGVQACTAACTWSTCKGGTINCCPITASVTGTTAPLICPCPVAAAKVAICPQPQ
ncbi:MAG TPA: hypothetical protein VMU50_00660 [Polyangia bacterium]|nr:hypothetical protein [Polyangia bacterium]